MSRDNHAAVRIAHLAAIAGLTLATPLVAMAQTPAFNFRSVEYLPVEQRAPAAQAFLAAKAPVGAPMAVAVQAVRHAGAYCPTPRTPDAPVSCISTSLVRDPGGVLSDVAWRVHLTPSSDGAVAEADVSRTRAGM